LKVGSNVLRDPSTSNISLANADVIRPMKTIAQNIGAIVSESSKHMEQNRALKSSGKDVDKLPATKGPFATRSRYKRTWMALSHLRQRKRSNLNAFRNSERFRGQRSPHRESRTKEGPRKDI
jgi:hypothetical protein